MEEEKSVKKEYATPIMIVKRINFSDVIVTSGENTIGEGVGTLGGSGTTTQGDPIGNNYSEY